MGSGANISGVDEPPAAVEYRAVSFSYPRRGWDGRPVENAPALKDITLSVRQGERLGVLGPNGGGKSTLLKLVAGLYQPTSGKVETSGPITLVAGLGIGMVDELTVEQNLLLYGAIYGLTRGEMRERLPEILDWAELVGFARAKLKTLSTGMRSRLAFSAMAYSLFLRVRRALAGTELERARPQTVRLRLFKIGALVRTSVRRIVLAFASGCPWAGLVRQCLAGIRSLPPPLSA